jgi:hypothetical protein
VHISADLCGDELFEISNRVVGQARDPGFGAQAVIYRDDDEGDGRSLNLFRDLGFFWLFCRLPGWLVCVRFLVAWVAVS